jgi:L-threonylcarbamoyladenylate synthase
MTYILDEQTAARLIAAGNVVALPTETFYGLAASPLRGDALSLLTRIKGRDEGKPVGLIASDTQAITSVTGPLSDPVAQLAHAAWPGPLTIVFPALPDAHPIVTGGTNTVAIRVPSWEPARTLARLSGGLITATSANKQGQPPPRTAEDVIRAFQHELDNDLLAGIATGGQTPGDKPSTLVRPDGTTLTVLREGAVDVTALRRIWSGDIVLAKPQ